MLFCRRLLGLINPLSFISFQEQEEGTIYQGRVMRILVLPGDGIGPEIVASAMQVLQAANRKFDLQLQFDFAEVGFVSLEKYGTTLRDEVLESARSYDGIILGTQSHADYPAPEKGGHNISAHFRVDLDLYANIRPARTRPFLPSNMKEGKKMDLVIMREATAGRPRRRKAQIPCLPPVCARSGADRRISV